MNQIDVFFAGAVDGKLIQLYKNVKEIEERHNTQCSWLLSVGHLGVWPSVDRMPGAAKKKLKESTGDFSTLLLNKWMAPRQTLFVAGAQDSHKWMKEYTRRTQSLEILPGVTWLRNGNSTTIGDTENTLKVLGLGKLYSPKVYNNIFTSNRLRYYKRNEVMRACATGKNHIFLSHAAPDGVSLQGRTSNSNGLADIIAATRPQLIVHGGLNISEVYKYGGIPSISLAPGDIRVVRFTEAEFEIIV